MLPIFFVKKRWPYIPQLIYTKTGFISYEIRRDPLILHYLTNPCSKIEKLHEKNVLQGTKKRKIMEQRRGKRYKSENGLLEANEGSFC